VVLRRGEKTVGSTKFSQMIQYKRAELQATENARLIGNPQPDFLEVGSSTMELRLATLRFGVNAVSSDIQVPTGSGDVRQR
jgi:hypothetical protein